MFMINVLVADCLLFYRKKIRIHIPQKVKHIHHHKKIYITNHVAQPTQFVPQYADPEQYASGYVSDASAGSPAYTFLPLAQGRKSTNHDSTPPNIQPLYRARGHYGPSSPTYITKQVTELKPKRVKVIKISEGKKKRIIKKKKPKRIIIQSALPVRDEKDSKPVSNYHEEFYSDLKSNQNTIRKVKKPKRVEKYVDGDTEHIHTYSEEHIHQVVYDDAPPVVSKPMAPMEMGLHQGVHSPIMHSAVPSSVIPSVIPSMASIQPASPIHIHPMAAYYGGIPGMGSMGTPSHFEYMQYDPKDVTHDHMYHDHGEIIHALIPEKKIPTSTKGSYENHELKINPSFSVSNIPSYEGKGSWVSGKTKQPNEQTFSYYENSYSQKKQKKPTESSRHKNPYTISSSGNLNKYKYTDEIPANSDVHYDDIITEYSKPQTSAKYYGNQNSPKLTKGHKTSSYAYSNSEMYKKPTSLQSLKQQKIHKVAQSKPYSTVPSYSESYSLGHHITINNNYKEPKEPTKLKHYTKIYSTSKPSSTIKPAVESFVVDHHKDLYPSSWRTGSKNKNKKSISTQNISFGGQEHKMVINHEKAESHTAESQIHDSAALPSNIEMAYPSTKGYYVHENHEANIAIPDASSINYRVVEAPMMVAEESKPGIVETVQIKEELNTTTPEPRYSTASTTIASVVKTLKAPRKIKKKNAEKKQPKPKVSESVRTQTEPTKDVKTTTRGRYKYGDKLQDRNDYEYDHLVFV